MNSLLNTKMQPKGCIFFEFLIFRTNILFYCPFMRKSMVVLLNQLKEQNTLSVLNTKVSPKSSSFGTGRRVETDGTFDCRKLEQ